MPLPGARGDGGHLTPPRRGPGGHHAQTQDTAHRHRRDHRARARRQHLALAATGGKFFLGQTNKANKQSTLKRTTSGPALGLVTRSSANAPLATNGRGKVGNLNADLLDGLDSTALKTSARVFTGDFSGPSAVASFDKALPLSTGRYLLSYSAHLLGPPSGELVRCYVRQAPSVGSISYVAQDSTDAGGAVSGSGLVTQAPGTTISIVCSSASTPISTAASEPVQVVAVKIDTASSTSLIPPTD